MGFTEIITPLLFTFLHYFCLASTSAESYTYGAFYESIVCNASHPIAYPSSVSDIQQIIRFAAAAGISVKAVGERHSATDIICTDGLPISLRNINHFRYESHSGIATVGGGATLEELTERLHLLGRGLQGSPLYGGITIGGAIGTGAHGSSLVSPSSLSDQMVGLVVVDGRGDVRNISGGGLLSAFRTHLGLLGIVYEVRVKTVEQYKIQGKHVSMSDSVLENVEELLEMARSSRFFSFWWFPTLKQVVLSNGTQVGVDVEGDCRNQIFSEPTRAESRTLRNMVDKLQEENDNLGSFFLQSFIASSFFHPVWGKSPIYVGGDGGDGGVVACNLPAVGFSHRMLAHKCNSCWWGWEEDSLILEETEVIIPVSELGGGISTIRDILAEAPTEFENGLYFRFITESDGILSVSRGREAVAVEWLSYPHRQRFTKVKLGLAPKQAMAQALISKHRGRAHWGKNGLAYSTPDMIQKQHELQNRLQFEKYMVEMDPRGLFLNDFGRRLKYGELKQTVDPQRHPHCAIGDHCLCQRDEDCGAPGEAKCDKLKDYPVCVRESSSVFEKVTVRLGRGVISGLQPVTGYIVNVANALDLTKYIPLIY